MKCLYAVTIVATCLLSSGVSSTKQTVPALQTPVHNYEISASSMIIALTNVAKTFRLVIGVSQSTRSNVIHFPVKARINDGTLADVLDALVKGNPGFRWNFEPNGAVHVTSAADGSTLTDVVLDKFEIEKTPLSHLSEAIYQAPAVQRWVIEQDCPRREMIVVFGEDREDGPSISLRAEREPLSKVLDAIALRTGNYFWSVSQYQVNEHCFSAITF